MVNKIVLMLKEKWLANSALVFMGKLVAMLFFALTDIVIARQLDVEGYGEWAFFYAILTMLYYFGWFGINRSTKIFVANSEDSAKRQNYFEAGFITRIIVSLAICLILYVVSYYVVPIFGYPSKYKNLKDLISVGIIIVFFNTFIEFYKDVYIGAQNYKRLFFVTVCEHAGYFLFVFIFLFINKTSIYVALGYASVGIILLGINLIINKKEFLTNCCKQSKKLIGYSKEIFKYALPLAVVSIAGMVLVELDTLMLGIMGTKYDVSVYNIAKQMCSKATHINLSLWTGALSGIALITKTNAVKKINEYEKIKTINTLVTIAVSLGMIIVLPLIIPVFYGEQYAEAGMLMYYLTPYYFLYCISSFYSTFLDFQKKAKQRSICYSSVIVFDLLFNYLLIPQMGAKGAALATVLSMLPYTIYVVVAANRHINSCK